MLQRTGYQIIRRPRNAATGWEDGLVRARANARLVPSPTFVLCPARSGSTLLRLLLNSHSKIRAPHEMHLWALHVDATKDYAAQSAKALQMDNEELEHQLWDRLLFRELQLSGKSVIVEKTPQNVLTWERLTRAWPDAKFVFLLRHPAAVLASMRTAAATAEPAAITRRLEHYVRCLNAARAALPGPTVQYEELTSKPEQVLRELCTFLGVDFEPTMLQYETNDEGPLVMGLGDWSDKVRSGRVHEATAVPEIDLSAPLRKAVAQWGYGES
jgi:hypothetical protein